MSKPSLWGKPTAFFDAKGVPIHIGDLLATKHFTHYRRRRQIFMHHLVIGPSDDPWVTPLSQVVTGKDSGGNVPLVSMLRNWDHVEIIADMGTEEDGFYDRIKDSATAYTNTNTEEAHNDRR